MEILALWNNITKYMQIEVKPNRLNVTSHNYQYQKDEEPLNKAILQERSDDSYHRPKPFRNKKKKKKPSLAIRGDVPRKIPSEIFSSRPHPRKETQKRGRSRARDLHAREINHKANNAAAKRETRIPGQEGEGARSLKLIHYTKHPPSPSFPRYSRENVP